MKLNIMFLPFLALLTIKMVVIQACDFTAKGICYEIISDTTAVVSSCENEANEVIIPAKVTYSGKEYIVSGIGNNAFSNCSRLIQVTIPQSVVAIGNQAFAGCFCLEEVVCENPVPIEINRATFWSPADALLYVPKGSKGSYSLSEVWSSFADIVEY